MAGPPVSLSVPGAAGVGGSCSLQHRRTSPLGLGVSPHLGRGSHPALGELQL